MVGPCGAGSASRLTLGIATAAEPGVRPRVGEIVVFRALAGAVPDIPVCGASGEGAGFSQACGVATPAISRQIFIKRIVAGPGDVVVIRGGEAVVNGATRSEPYAVPCDDPDCNFPAPAGQFYVLGDNRGDSDDSRFWGPVPASSIVGVAVRCQLLQTDSQPRQ
jgi:signal peptidase I